MGAAVILFLLILIGLGSAGTNEARWWWWASIKLRNTYSIY
uniref:Uncharacterized protein n=1 Tax=Wuchereria bancrofti TaxID=6293 RepID=A0AAF5PUD4_WUCBA